MANARACGWYGSRPRPSGTEVKTPGEGLQGERRTPLHAVSPGYPRFRAALAGASMGVIAGCAVPRTPATLPPPTEPYVAVLSGEMPGAISQVARHSWIVANVPGEPYLQRFEMGSSYSDPFKYFGEGDVAVHGIVHYD